MVQSSSFFLSTMTTKTKNRAGKAKSLADSLKRRIEQYYDLLNRGQFERCYGMIDPQVREDSTAVTMLQYSNSLRRFRDHFGCVEALEIAVSVHHNEPSKLYGDRDFALGRTTWLDRSGEEHVFS